MCCFGRRELPSLKIWASWVHRQSQCPCQCRSLEKESPQQDAAVERSQPSKFRLLYRCWSMDLVGHGSKTIGSWAWRDREEKGKAELNCTYNMREEELDLARRCCLWHFPGVATFFPSQAFVCKQLHLLLCDALSPSRSYVPALD